MTRPKSNVVEYAAILAESDFAFGAAIEIIKYRLRHSLAGDGAEILYANNSRRRHRSGGSCHLRFRCPDLETVRHSNTAGPRLLSFLSAGFLSRESGSVVNRTRSRRGRR